jgi:Tfp pilus assembly protein PilO
MSALGELRERYKLLPLAGRLLLVGALGLLPALYIYLDEGATLEETQKTLQQQVDDSRQKFTQASQKHSNLPKLEEQLQSTQQQLVKAKKKLPDTYQIELILEKVATFAKGNGVIMSLFDPTEEVKHQQPYPFVELPIVIEVLGTFDQVAHFLDQLVHLEGTIFLRNLQINRAEARDLAALQDGDSAGKFNSDQDKRSLFQKTKDARSNMRLKTHLELVVYRSMTNLEANGAGKPEQQNGPKANNQSDEDKKKTGNSENSAAQNVGKLMTAPKIAKSKI